MQDHASVKNFRHCKTRLRIICEEFPGMAWLDAKTMTEEGTEATRDQKRSTLEGNLLGNWKTGLRFSWASYLCKRRYHRTNHLTAHCKRNQSRGFPASWGIVSKETTSMEAQRPEAADFTRARLMLGPHYNTSWQGSKPNVLSSFTHSRSQVKLSEDKWINCGQTTTVQVALAGPCTLVTLAVATSCTLLLKRKLCSTNSKCCPKVPLDFSVCRLSNYPKATRSISAT